MSVETKKVLEMLAEGKITAEDAERLLDKLAAVKEPPENSTAENQESSRATPARKYLRIVVDNGAGKNVNMRVPLSFVRTGVGLMAVLPPRVAQRLNDKGFDFSALKDLKGDELNEALNTLNINIDSNDGKHMRIFCE